jgi:hypothetical protein
VGELGIFTSTGDFLVPQATTHIKGKDKDQARANCIAVDQILLYSLGQNDPIAEHVLVSVNKLDGSVLTPPGLHRKAYAGPLSLTQPDFYKFYLLRNMTIPFMILSSTSLIC